MKTFLTILLVSSAVASTTATSNKTRVTDCKLFNANNVTIDVKNGLSIEGLSVAMKAGTEFATLKTESVESFSISNQTYITVNLDKDSQILAFSTTVVFENYQRFEIEVSEEPTMAVYKSVLMSTTLFYGCEACICREKQKSKFASPMFVFPLTFSNIYPPEFLVDNVVVESVTFNISMPFPKISLTKNYHTIYAIDMDLQNNNISFELDDIGKKYLEMTPTQLKNGLRTNYSIDLTPITVLNIETELAIYLNAWDSGNPSMNSSLEILFTPDVKATTPISPWFKEAFYLADMSDLTSETITKDTIQPISFSSSITLQEGYDEQLTIYLSGDSNDSFTAKLNTNLPVPSVEINLVGTPSEELLQLPFVTFELTAERDGALKPGRTAIFIKLPGSLCVESTTTTEVPTTVTTECDCSTEETTAIEPCPTTFTPEISTPCPDCICTTETTESSVAGQTSTTSGETTPEGNSTPVNTATTTSGQSSPSSGLTTQFPTLPECDCSADTTESSVAGQTTTTSGETTPEGNSTPVNTATTTSGQTSPSSGLTTECPPIPECISTTETSLVTDKTSSSTGETSKSTKNTSSVTDPITPSTDEPSHCTPCPSSSDQCPTTSSDTPQDCSSCPTLPTEPSSDTSSTGQTGARQTYWNLECSQTGRQVLDRGVKCNMNRAIVHHAHHHQTNVLPRAVILLKTALPAPPSHQNLVQTHHHQTNVLPRAVILLKTALPARPFHQNLVQTHHHQTNVLPRAVILLKTALPAPPSHQNLVQTHHHQTNVLPRAVILLKTALPAPPSHQNLVQTHHHQTNVLPRAVILLKTALPAPPSHQNLVQTHHHQTNVLPRAVILLKTALPAPPSHQNLVQTHHHQTNVLPRAVILLKTALPAPPSHQNLVQTHHHQTNVLPRAVILLKTALPAPPSHQNLVQTHHHQTNVLPRAVILLKTALPAPPSHQNLVQTHHHQTNVLPRAVILLKTALPAPPSHQNLVQTHHHQTNVLPRAVILLKTALPAPPSHQNLVQTHHHQTNVLPRAVILLKTALPAPPSHQNLVQTHHHQTNVLPRAVILLKTALPAPPSHQNLVQTHHHQTNVLPRAVILLKTALPAPPFHQNLVQTHHQHDKQPKLKKALVWLVFPYFSGLSCIAFCWTSSLKQRGRKRSTTSTPVTVKFQRSLYVFPSVSQNNEGIRIGRVEADVTGTSELPIYSLEDSKDNFVINSSNGDITVKQSVDPGTWVVSVMATCEAVVDKTQVQVTVSNFVNCLNNETKLVNTLLTMEFPEESEQTIYDIPEPDLQNCNWRKVSEEPFSGTDGFYVVYENGTILTSGIDREDNIFNNMSVAEVLLQVNVSCPNDETYSEATSDGTSDRKFVRDLEESHRYPLRNLRNSHRDMYFLTFITDINDNNPEFEGTNPLIVGYPDAKVVKQLLPQSMATVKATDKDIGINALIRYEIEQSDVSSWFVIHPHTGVIYPSENHFQFKDAEFNVIAKDLDGGQGCLQSEKLVVKMKILAIEHLSVLSIEGKLVEDANETVLAIGNSLNYTVKVLLSAVVPSTEATIRSSSSSLSRVLRAVDDDTQSSLLYLVIYAIDKTTQEPVPAETFNNQLASSNPSWKVSQLSSSSSQSSTGSSENNGALLGGVIALAVILILLLGGAGVAYYVLRVRRRNNTQTVDYDNFTAADSDSISRENHVIEEIPYLEKPAEVTVRSVFNEYDEIVHTNSTEVNKEDTSRPAYQNNIALSFNKDFSLIKEEDDDRKNSFTLQGSESEETSDEPQDDRQTEATDTIDDGRDEEMVDLSSKSIVKFNDNVELIEIERL
uniref:Cadherin domain-containing protein n=1 Tax=Timema bartmani TaxID=61472 RepID=A0A7R9EX08_9NEOP|nr:unnamed protein product [Timema bartmani]